MGFSDVVIRYFDVIYLTGVTLLSILLGIWCRNKLNRTEQKRIQRLNQRVGFDPLFTESPLEDPDEATLLLALRSIETRFIAFRRILFPALIGVWALIILLPYISKVPAALLSSILGIIAVVVGIAARPFIENVVAGLVLSFTQPLRIGDTLLIDSHWGMVENIALTFTVIRVWDWRRYIIPNSQLLHKEFLNYSLVDEYQWAYVEFWVEYESDLTLVETLCAEAATESTYFAPHEKPAFWVMEMDKDGVRCWCAGWANNASDAWKLTHDIRTNLIARFKEHGVRCHRFEHSLRTDRPDRAAPIHRGN